MLIHLLFMQMCTVSVKFESAACQQITCSVSVNNNFFIHTITIDKHSCCHVSRAVDHQAHVLVVQWLGVRLVINRSLVYTHARRQQLRLHALASSFLFQFLLYRPMRCVAVSFVQAPPRTSWLGARREQRILTAGAALSVFILTETK